MKISCIICAHNEAPRIGAVLDVVVGHPLLDEVIVMEDGSTDGTPDVVRRYQGVRLISGSARRGKSKALAQGAEMAQGEYLLCLDADLQNLTKEDISALIEPVAAARADMTISMRKNSLPIYRAIGLDFVSGERLVPRAMVMDYLSEIEKLPNFGIEVYMNARIIERKLRIAVVWLDNVIQTRRSEKMGWWKGTVSDWRGVGDVLHILSPWGVIKMNMDMKKLSRSVS